MTPEMLTSIIANGGLAAGLAISNWLLWQIITYQRSEKAACQKENSRLVDLLVKHSDLDASAILNHKD